MSVVEFEPYRKLIQQALYKAAWAFESIEDGDADGTAYEELLEVQEYLLKALRMYFDDPQS